MAFSLRKRGTLHLPITLSVALMTLNIALMVIWIVLFAQLDQYPMLTIGTIAFSLILVGLSIYMFLTIKAIRLNRRQANFVDSVTHELKTPIASLQLYLETLQMRSLTPEQCANFYGIMETQLQRLDGLINQLLEVGRLDAIGHQSQPEDLLLEPLLRRCASTACTNHNQDADKIFTFDVAPAIVNARRMVVEMIFGNLFDNAVKYGAERPLVDVEVRVKDRGRVVVKISDNGQGVPVEHRKKIFKLFYRGGNELERTKKGTGLGLYIVRTLVHILKGKISVYDRAVGSGSVFEVELPGRAAA
ncbi:MAG: HAMP domain-containing sensor histidine kinase [Planctomycetaceae bacterium]